MHASAGQLKFGCNCLDRAPGCRLYLGVSLGPVGYPEYMDYFRAVYMYKRASPVVQANLNFYA